MPCNTVQTNTVDLGKITRHDLLEAALKAEFGQVTKIGSKYVFQVAGTSVTLADGALTSRFSEAQLADVAGRVKRSMSRETVKFAAKKFGWLVQPGPTADEFVIIKN